MNSSLCRHRSAILGKYEHLNLPPKITQTLNQVSSEILKRILQLKGNGQMETTKAVQKTARGGTWKRNGEDGAEAGGWCPRGSARRGPSPRVAQGCPGARAVREGAQLRAHAPLPSGGASSGCALNRSRFSIFYLPHPPRDVSPLQGELSALSYLRLPWERFSSYSSVLTRRDTTGIA